MKRWRDGTGTKKTAQGGEETENLIYEDGAMKYSGRSAMRLERMVILNSLIAAV